MAEPLAQVHDLAREAVDELLHDKVLGGRRVTVVYQLPMDYVQVAADYDQPDAGGATGGAVVQVYTTGGPQDLVDGVDATTVEVYAPGTSAMAVAGAASKVLVADGMPHDLGVGYVDEIACRVRPHDVPYPHDTIRQARAVYDVTSRDEF